MRVGYRRISTANQKFDRQELGDIDRLFEEQAGGGRDRPVLEEMIGFVRDGDMVAVHSIDRLARNLRDLQDIVGRLNARGASVAFLSEGLLFRCDDADDPFARLQLQMIGAFAEFERNIIRQRQAEGIAKAKARGVYRGRRPVIDAAEVEQLRQKGIGVSAIARRLGIHRASVYRVLRKAKPE